MSSLRGGSTTDETRPTEPIISSQSTLKKIQLRRPHYEAEFSKQAFLTISGT